MRDLKKSQSKITDWGESKRGKEKDLQWGNVSSRLSGSLQTPPPSRSPAKSKLKTKNNCAHKPWELKIPITLKAYPQWPVSLHRPSAQQQINRHRHDKKHKSKQPHRSTHMQWHDLVQHVHTGQTLIEAGGWNFGHWLCKSKNTTNNPSWHCVWDRVHLRQAAAAHCNIQPFTPTHTI